MEPKRRKALTTTAGLAASPLYLTGDGLTLTELSRVVRLGTEVALSEDPEITRRMHQSVAFIDEAVAAQRPIYGVNTNFGGLADTLIDAVRTAELQNNLIRGHKMGLGGFLPSRDVRAAMVLRVNALLHGASGIRPTLLARICTFLNHGVTPLVHQYGSIGASGDLVPLAYIAGAVLGTDPSFRVTFGQEEMGCLTALARLELPPISLRAKEGLALINGTAVSTGIAANVVCESQVLFALTLMVQGLLIQALRGSSQSFHPFIHSLKPHPGQVWVAAVMRDLLGESKMVRDEAKHGSSLQEGHLIQDRYSLRCLPQFLGPILDGLVRIGGEVETEMNAATDNPLVDMGSGQALSGGNFLSQYVGLGMDQLRHYLGLCAKHVDVQIAQVMTPAFSFGLPASLVGNAARQVNVGLKPLQIAGNSLMPLLGFYGNSLVDRFPTHAEQYNQNLNSQSFGAAHLARQSIEIMEQYLGLSLIVCIQAVDLRTREMEGHYDGRSLLSEPTRACYEAVLDILALAPTGERPYLFDDGDRHVDEDVGRLVSDLRGGGRLQAVLSPMIKALRTAPCPIT